MLYGSKYYVIICETLKICTRRNRDERRLFTSRVPELLSLFPNLTSPEDLRGKLKIQNVLFKIVKLPKGIRN